MDLQPGHHIRSALPQQPLTYPLHKVVAAVAPSVTDVVAAALDEAGFAPNRVEIVSTDEVKGLGDPNDGSRLQRLLIRLQLLADDALDEPRVRGLALVQVRVHSHEEEVRVHAILNQHEGTPTHSYGRWTITSIDHR